MTTSAQERYTIVGTTYYWLKYFSDNSSAVLGYIVNGAFEAARMEGYVEEIYVNNHLTDGQNSLTHALTSMWMTLSYGAETSREVGIAKEFWTYRTELSNGDFRDKFKDLYNNNIGRQIGLFAIANGLSADEATALVLDAYKNNTLILNVNDARIDSSFDGDPLAFDENGVPLWIPPLSEEDFIARTIEFDVASPVYTLMYEFERPQYGSSEAWTGVIGAIGTDEVVDPTSGIMTSSGFSVDVVDQITGQRSTITHTLNTTTGTLTYVQRDTNVISGTTLSTSFRDVTLSNVWDTFDASGNVVGAGSTIFKIGNLTQNFGNLGNYAFSQVDLQQSDKFVRQLVWSNLQTGGPALTVDVAYDPVTNAVQSATITDNANNFDWSRQDVREVFSNPGSATSSGITVTSTQLDGGERVITLERDAGVTTNDVNNDGVVDQEDADIIFGSGGDDISGGEGLDILEGGAGEDQLNADGSKTRYTVTGWRPEIRAGYTFNDVVNNFGEIKVFGEEVDLTAPILSGSQIGAVFGSTLGRFIAGDNLFAQVGSGADLLTMAANDNLEAGDAIAA